MHIAVDPGLGGALALFDGPELLSVVDMPTYVKEAGARKTDRRFLDEGGLRAHLVDWAIYRDAQRIFVEDVSGVPGQSAPASFQFGYGVGYLVATATACGLVIERVHASVWKAKMKVPKDKRAARARASELMPAHAHNWPLQKHDGRAEAALLGLYGAYHGATVRWNPGDHQAEGGR